MKVLLNAVFAAAGAAASGATPPVRSPAAASCPAATAQAEAGGLSEVAPLPSPRAQELNRQGKALYREGRWAEARARYQAALAADPGFLAAALNLACAHAREERHADAAREAAALIRRAFVPWGREVMEAADLAVLHARPELATLRAALAEAAPAWGSSLDQALLFVARVRPAVRSRGEGVLTLGLHQEVFAWVPRAGRFRQVTADDGRVLAFARSPDGRSLVYVRGGKLVRRSGHPAHLRSLALVRLDLTTMSAAAPVELPGDVASLELWPLAGGGAEVRVAEPAGPGQGRDARVFRLAGASLAPLPALSPAARATAPPAHLTGQGVTAPGRTDGPADCRFRATDDFAPDRPPRVAIQAGRRRFTLAARYGAGLAGLPFDRGE
jgi:hypothetical protein